MCYTTDEKVNPRTEVTYDERLPYGKNGYRTNCNNIEVSLSCDGQALFEKMLP